MLGSTADSNELPNIANFFGWQFKQKSSLVTLVDHDHKTVHFKRYMFDLMVRPRSLFEQSIVGPMTWIC